MTRKVAVITVTDRAEAAARLAKLSLETIVAFGDAAAWRDLARFAEAGRVEFR